MTYGADDIKISRQIRFGESAKDLLPNTKVFFVSFYDFLNNFFRLTKLYWLHCGDKIYLLVFSVFESKQTLVLLQLFNN